MKIITSMFLLVFFSSAMAYESSDFVKIISIRPAIDGNVYFEVETPAAMCGTSVFLVKVKDDGSKAVYSALISAAISEKLVKIETWGICAPDTGWGTEIQAVTVRF